MIGLQKAFHRRDRTWISLLGAEQKSVDRNRDAMMKKVRNIWITGFLERSLSHETRILLGLSERPDAVVRSMDLLVQRPDQGERPLPPGTPIVEVFDAMEQLLILGLPAPGRRRCSWSWSATCWTAPRGPDAPDPRRLPPLDLGRIAASPGGMAGGGLHQRYDVPRKIGQPWVEADQILPLLDGLDEVKPAHRAAASRPSTPSARPMTSPLVICSRTADYQALSEPLQLYGAVVVQPLTHLQVDSYLTEIGPVGEVVREAIRHDPTQGEQLLDTPLMLDIVTVAYTGPSESQSRMMGNLEERRDKLFGAYVDQMFKRRSVSRRYKQGQTLHWLSWLAREMADHGQTVFYLERLQLDWLPRRRQWFIRVGYSLAIGQVGGFFGLVIGLVSWLVEGLVGRKPSLSVLVSWLVDGLVSGLVGGLVFGLISWLSEGLSVSEIETRAVPNQGIHRSARNALVVGLVAGLVFGLVVGLVKGLVFGLVIGLVAGLVGWLSAAGRLAGRLAVGLIV